MRRLGDLMKDLGFNPDASLDTQRAFFKHLARAAENSVPKKLEINIEKKKESFEHQEPKQLSFDSEVLGQALNDYRVKCANIGKK